MATHSSILVWRIPRTEEPVGYGPWDSNSWNTTEHMYTQVQGTDDAFCTGDRENQTDAGDRR